MDFYGKLCQCLNQDHIKTNEDMRQHTTFRAGGRAAYFVCPDGRAELEALLALCSREKTEFTILGNGSNMLVGDGGYDGVIVDMTAGFQYVRVSGEDALKITAGAGTLLSKTAKTALEAELTGLEFAAGIPGTVGGATVMNAGAYGSELKNVIETATVMDREGRVLTLSKEELELGYRASCIIKNKYVVLEADFSLKKGDPKQIRLYMEDLALQRRTKQPLEYPSAGSTFKRPAGYFAGKLIQDAGLRGFCLGGAQVSEKHCGFVINRDNATAADLINLCKEVQKRVKAESGVDLEMEVKTIGRF